LCELKVYDIASTNNFSYHIFYKTNEFLGSIKSDLDVLYIFYKLEFYLNLSLFRHYLN